MQLRTCQPVVRAFGCAGALPDQISRPPRLPCQLGGLSGRPGCRIYARDDVWVLELDALGGGWLEDRDGRHKRLTFPTLAAAIRYAERHGLDYRIEPKRAQRSGKLVVTRSRRPPALAARPRRQRRRSPSRAC